MKITQAISFLFVGLALAELTFERDLSPNEDDDGPAQHSGEEHYSGYEYDMECCVLSCPEEEEDSSPPTSKSKAMTRQRELWSEGEYQYGYDCYYDCSDCLSEDDDDDKSSMHDDEYDSTPSPKKSASKPSMHDDEYYYSMPSKKGDSDPSSSKSSKDDGKPCQQCYPSYTTNDQGCDCDCSCCGPIHHEYPSHSASRSDSHSGHKKSMMGDDKSGKGKGKGYSGKGKGGKGYSYKGGYSSMMSGKSKKKGSSKSGGSSHSKAMMKMKRRAVEENRQLGGKSGGHGYPYPPITCSCSCYDCHDPSSSSASDDDSYSPRSKAMTSGGSHGGNSVKDPLASDDDDSHLPRSKAMTTGGFEGDSKSVGDDSSKSMDDEYYHDSGYY